MPRMLITGGAGFIGSHAAIYFAGRGWEVRILDNLSRGRLLHRDDPNASHNWDRLRENARIERIRGDVRDAGTVESAVDGMDAVLHAAAQTAVTVSTDDPGTDFETNAIGTFRLLDAVRRTGRKAAVIYCSTNKVYGDRANLLSLREGSQRYEFTDEHSLGIGEEFGVDLCEHTPYGCSKLTGDLYVQDYGHLYGIRTAVFRMSCIYGTHQFGMEDQGWVAWFAIAARLGAPLTIYGDGKQVRDVLWVDDLVTAYEAFLDRGPRIGVYNMGGGPEYTLSLRELLAQLEAELGRPVPVASGPWRPSDQKVYVSDIRKARRELRWSPQVPPHEGVNRLLSWVEQHEGLFAHLR
jgi:CDP-paratose 2-epimerase